VPLPTPEGPEMTMGRGSEGNFDMVRLDDWQN